MLILTIIVIGMAAGWVAQQILGRGTHLGEALIAGLIGSFIGGLLASLIMRRLGHPADWFDRDDHRGGDRPGDLGSDPPPVHDRASGLTRYGLVASTLVAAGSGCDARRTSRGLVEAS